jgi:metal-sulfur cluster biosynthetic enzyme
MRDDITGALPFGRDDPALRERLAEVLDPELDEPILDLGFVAAAERRAGHATVALRLPTSWCAVNFAYLMAEDVHRALLALEGVDEVTVRLGDHCAAAAIEAAVNSGRSFAEAFPGEGGGSLDALRLTFRRKGFVIRQERLLRQLRLAGLSWAGICALRLGDAPIEDGEVVVRQPGGAPVAGGPAAVLQRFLDRRAELGLDCGVTAPLCVDLDGRPLSAERLERTYEAARTMRVALEANGAFCRALLAMRRGDDVATSAPPNPGGRHVQV